LDFNKKLENMTDEALRLCKEKFREIEALEEINAKKVLNAFIKSKVSESHFAPTTGYGYSDRGREKLDELFSHIFSAGDSIVRSGFVSGTHALSTALFGVLRPGDKILSVTGMPYDTMLDVIDGGKNNFGSLKDFGIEFEYFMCDLSSENYLDELKAKLSEICPKAIYIQRSRGYSLRPSLSVNRIGEIISLAKMLDSKIISVVDNCYGEFSEVCEPTEYGADLIVGSLIKNPGGGIARSGGYISGKRELVDKCAHRLTAPGIGKEIGSSPVGNMDIFMGIYNAPKVVAEALKTATFASALFELAGYEVYPKYFDKRCDIVQSIVLRSAEELTLFCQGIQSASPVDSFVLPEPWEMPGYQDKVVMAAGNFISGSSVELSADGPLREPYAVWVQGGTSFSMSKFGIISALERILKSK